ncbi:hypothetical protein QJS66_16555 [Kocuria rhizophila]|nr:hypothetical protein QJS66_16555 [Kocuria rhizophila]
MREAEAAGRAALDISGSPRRASCWGWSTRSWTGTSPALLDGGPAGRDRGDHGLRRACGRSRRSTRAGACTRLG